MTSFSILWQPQARKYLRKLPSEVSKRIVKKVKSILDAPFNYLEHLEGNGYKLRIGDYRLLIDVDFENRILKIRILDKRGRIYKRQSMSS